MDFLEKRDADEAQILRIKRIEDTILSFKSLSSSLLLKKSFSIRVIWASSEFYFLFKPSTKTLPAKERYTIYYIVYLIF
jgi:hypothetical protein